jgi:hypothetical protein
MRASALHGGSLFPTERVLVSGPTLAQARREAEVAAPLVATR